MNVARNKVKNPEAVRDAQNSRLARLARNYRTTEFECDTISVTCRRPTTVVASGRWLSIYRASNGGIEVYRDNKSLVGVDRGGFVCVTSGEAHGITAQCDHLVRVERLRLLIRTHLLADLTPAVFGLASTQVKESQGLANCWSSIFAEDERPRFLLHEMRCRLADVIALSFLDRLMQHEIDDFDTQRGGIYDHRMRRVTKLISANLEKEWSLASLANASAMSRASFARQFHEAIGETPMAYVRRARLAHACTLLEGEDLLISEIAQRCGFRTDISFHRAFKREIGSTPGAFRLFRRSKAVTASTAADSGSDPVSPK